jgi:hypothetical protein
MSIIYDALKKVEKTNSDASAAAAPEENKKTPQKVYLLYALVVAAGIGIAGLSFSIFSRLPKEKLQALPEVAPPPEALNLTAQAETPPKEEPAPELVLNGVFFSADQGYALINNQVVKEGDTVAGATVLRIGRDNVELKFKDSILKLPSPK